MDIQTDRSLVAVGETAIRYCTVTVTLPPGRLLARKAELVVRDSIAASTICLTMCEADVDADGLHVQLGDLTAIHRVTVVLATTIEARAKGAATSVLLRLADQDDVFFTAPVQVAWLTASAEADLGQPLNRDVLTAAAVAIQERAKSEALELEYAGASDRAEEVVTAATRRINELRKELARRRSHRHAWWRRAS
jgi:hypothetical protein